MNDNSIHPATTETAAPEAASQDSAEGPTTVLAKKEKKRANARAWRAANHEKVRAYNQAYSRVWYEANREKICARSRKWYDANLEKAQARRRMQYASNREEARTSSLAWYYANREKATAKKRARYAATPEKERAAARAANKEKRREKICEQQRAWYAANREKVLAKNRARHAANPEKRRARQREDRVSNLASFLVKRAHERAKKRGVECDISPETIFIPQSCPIFDVPLAIGRNGPAATSPSLDRVDPTRGYTRDNVVVISHRANRIKNDATPDELEKVASYVRRIIDAAEYHI